MRMSDSEQCIECAANCALFICEVLCFCCFTDSNWCNTCGNCCEDSPRTRTPDTYPNPTSAYPSRCATTQPTRGMPYQVYHPTTVLSEVASAPSVLFSEEATLLTPSQEDAPPSYEEVMKSKSADVIFKAENETK